MPGGRLLCALALLTSTILALPTGAQAQAIDLPPAGAACDEAALGPEQKVLVFSETTGFRHASIPVGRADQIRFNGTEITHVGPTARPASGRAPLRVSFKADGPPGATYAWDFGDGTTASGRRVVHRYTEPGTYTATVTVTDRYGGTASDRVEVTVTPPP
jgi:PKD repeat protein